jgi:hypothetical protein
MIDCTLCSDRADIFILKPDQTLLPICNRCVDRMALISRLRPELEEIFRVSNADRLN